MNLMDKNKININDRLMTKLNLKMAKPKSYG